MPDNTIRVGAVIDASGIPGGLDALLDALASARANYNTTSVDAAAALARLKQAHKDLDKASADSKDQAANFLTAAKIAYEQADATAQQHKATVQGLELVLKSLGFAAQNVQAATTGAASGMNGATAAAQGLAGAANQAAVAMNNLGAQAGAVGGNIGAVMSGAAAAAGGAVPPIQNAGNAAATASIPIFRIYALLFMVRRALDALDKFRESEEQLANFSAASGIAAEQLAQLQGAIAIAGGNSEKFDGAILHLARSMEQAQRGNATMSDELKRLGVSTNDPVQAFMQIADTVHNTSDRMAALEAASRVLGASEADLVGVMSQGSTRLQEYMQQSKQLADARAAAIAPSQELTRIEQMFKTALDGTVASSMPAMIDLIKGLATAFEGLILPVKIAIDAIIDGFTGAINVAGNFGAVISDGVHGNFAQMLLDSQNAIEGMKREFLHFGEDVKADTEETQKFISDLWSKQDKVPAPSAKKPFPGPTDPKAYRKAEEDLRHQDEEDFADLQASHQLSIQEEINFWEQRLANEQKYSDRVREIKRTLGRDFQRLDAEQQRDLKEQVREQAAAMEEAINEGREQAASKGGKRGELSYLQGQQADLLGKLNSPQIDMTEWTAALAVYKKIMDEMPRIAREAAKESDEAVKKGLQQQFDTWNEGGKHSLQAQKEFWAQAIADSVYSSDALEFAYKKWQEASRNLADELRKVTVELRDLQAAADAASQTHILNMEELDQAREIATRLFPSTNDQKVDDLIKKQDFDRQRGQIAEGQQQERVGAAFEKYNETGNDQDYVKFQQESNKLAQIVAQNSEKMKADTTAVAKQILAPWQQAFGTISNGFSKAFGDMLIHGKSFGKDMVQIFQSLEQQGINYVVGLATKWIEEHLLMGLASKILGTDTVASTTAAAATQTAVTTAANLTMATSDAGLAAAGTFAYYSSFAPEIAPAMAAAAYAEGLGFASMSAEHGAVLPNANTLVFAHPQEMILPRHLSLGIQDMIANGGARGGAAPIIHQHNYGGVHVNAGSNASPNDIGRAAYSGLQRHARNNHQRIG